MTRSARARTTAEERRFQRLAGWFAILALPLAYANVGLGLFAVDFDVGALSDLAKGLDVVAARPGGAELVRWSMITDMLGFYLLLVPLALVLYHWLQGHERLMMQWSTAFGLAYLFLGAMGAAVLAAVLPAQVEAVAAGLPEAAAGVAAEVSRTLFLAVSQAIYGGVWDILDPLLAGTWLVVTGIYMRHHRRALGWMAVVVGVFVLLREVKVGSVSLIALGLYLVFVPLWAALTGLDLVRRPAPALGAGRLQEREER